MNVKVSINKEKTQQAFDLAIALDDFTNSNSDVMTYESYQRLNEAATELFQMAKSGVTEIKVA